MVIEPRYVVYVTDVVTHTNYVAPTASTTTEIVYYTATATQTPSATTTLKAWGTPTSAMTQPESVATQASTSAAPSTTQSPSSMSLPSVVFVTATPSSSTSAPLIMPSAVSPITTITSTQKQTLTSTVHSTRTYSRAIGWAKPTNGCVFPLPGSEC